MSETAVYVNKDGLLHNSSGPALIHENFRLWVIDGKVAYNEKMLNERFDSKAMVFIKMSGGFIKQKAFFEHWADNAGIGNSTFSQRHTLKTYIDLKFTDKDPELVYADRIHSDKLLFKTIKKKNYIYLYYDTSTDYGLRTNPSVKHPVCFLLDSDKVVVHTGT